MSYAVGDLTKLLNPDADAIATVPKKEIIKKTKKSTSSKKQTPKKETTSVTPATAQALFAASKILKDKSRQFKRNGDEMELQGILADYYNNGLTVADEKNVDHEDYDDDEDDDDDDEKWSKAKVDIYGNNDDEDQQGKIHLSERFIESVGVRVASDGVDPEDKVIVKKKKSKDEIAREIFVGNIPIETTENEIKQLFKEIGTLEAIRFRSIAFNNPKVPKKLAYAQKLFHSERTSMNAYIRFKTLEMAEQALTMHNTIFKGHHIRVDKADGEKKKVDIYRSVFVGNLAFDLEEEELYTFFETCGQVEDVRIVRDTHMNIGKGFGFVTFADKVSVGQALKLSGKKLNDREIRITKVSAHGFDKNSIAYKTQLEKQKVIARAEKQDNKMAKQINKRKRELLGEDADEVDGFSGKKVQGAFQKVFQQKQSQAGFQSKKPRHEARPNAGKIGGVLQPKAWMGQTAKRGDTPGRLNSAKDPRAKAKSSKKSNKNKK